MRRRTVRYFVRYNVQLQYLSWIRLHISDLYCFHAAKTTQTILLWPAKPHERFNLLNIRDSWEMNFLLVKLDQSLGEIQSQTWVRTKVNNIGRPVISACSLIALRFRAWDSWHCHLKGVTGEDNTKTIILWN